MELCDHDDDEEEMTMMISRLMRMMMTMTMSTTTTNNNNKKKYTSPDHLLVERTQSAHREEMPISSLREMNTMTFIGQRRFRREEENEDLKTTFLFPWPTCFSVRLGGHIPKE